jgi:hypothetical protein
VGGRRLLRLPRAVSCFMPHLKAWPNWAGENRTFEVITQINKYKL